MPAITKPNQHFDATTYTGTGSALSVTNGGFQPDFVWIKSRAIVAGHGLVDSVRGRASVLYSNDTAAQGTSGSTQDVTAFNSNGFALGTNSQIESNTNASTYVAWQWKGGGTAVSNTSGTITSSVSANPTAGFSVVTYTHNGTNAATVGHGLGVTPSFIINKQRSAAATNWRCYHVSLTAGYNIQLNLTSAQGTAADIFQTAPTSSVFTPGNGDSASGQTMVAYCFAPIAGYSAFGSYVGNSSADGPFLYTGFRPRWVMLKVASGQTGDWLILDTTRDTYNVASNLLYANSTAAQDSPGGYTVDIVSNGFKLRNSSFGFNNTSGTYIYAAFAEAPFKYAGAR